MAGEQQTRPEMAVGLDGGAATPRPEVGEGLTAGPPPASDRAKKEKEGTRCWAGGREKMGQLGPSVCAGGKEGQQPGHSWAERKEEGKGEGSWAG
jgi:hypothetical protein